MGPNNAANTRRLRVTRHVTQQTISLAQIDDEGPACIFHIGVGDPIAGLLAEISEAMTYERWGGSNEELDGDAIVCCENRTK